MLEKLKEYAKKPLPAYYLIIVLVMVSILGPVGCQYFSPKPKVDTWLLQAHASQRISAKLDKNKSQLQSLLDSFKLLQENAKDEETKKLLAEYYQKLSSYKKDRDDSVGSLLEYLKLSIQEYKALHLLLIGEMKGEMKKVFDESLKELEK